MDTKLDLDSSMSTNDSNVSDLSNNTAKQRIVMLTTVDNPFDPLIQFNDWLAFDFQKGYDCCGYLDRMTQTSELLSDEVNDAIKEEAIDEIVRLNVFGVYKKLVKYL